ncbi:hypothetical protein LG047_04650 [Methylocystis sp. WRRC1]|uniref:hypothetical protein n=1 Tax=Methylocystis sp. WRRC1 TaxID=1732014 RepID=UPI001D144591|nr:hypothetical protein [Methylocystis sp. WRRC1]MCC3244619.1 hypothetical protein [Methylocystis sp. WRRC1]
MRQTPLALLALVLTLASAFAATPEEAYLAARDAAIAKIKKLEAKQGAEDAVGKEQQKALADLEKRLQGIIGDLAVKPYPAKGKINIDTLSENEIGFGMLDTLRFSQEDNGAQAIVTTDGLLDHWLRTQSQWWKKTDKSAPDAESALKSDDFYTEAIGSDAAFTKTADIPIMKPEGAVFAVALLGGWAQDIGPNPSQEIIVALRRGGKVYIATEAAKGAEKIPACDAIWKDAESKAEKILQKYNEGGMKDEKLFDESTAAQTKGDDDYRACYAARAPKEAFFAALTREAQEIADRFKDR